jgi:hypothetical protein
VAHKLMLTAPFDCVCRAINLATACEPTSSHTTSHCHLASFHAVVKEKRDRETDLGNRGELLSL